MSRASQQFPIVADDEPVITAAKSMQLYDNEDLIPNISGEYQEKDYLGMTQDYTLVGDTAEIRPTSPEPILGQQQSYVSRAREKARQDIKRKRQVFLGKDAKKMSSSFGKMNQKTAPMTSYRQAVNDELTGLARAANKLRQDIYILAELPKVYEQPHNESRQKSGKNSYDFLKKSQVYNYQENESQKERQVAQELNLTRFN